MARILWLWGLLSAAAAAFPDSPLTPSDALQSFEHAAGLKIELVAAEPLVASPCAMAFDERGRLFVAENRGYPRTSDPPQGSIALLEDTDRDGRMDKRTVFADGLTFPNGVLPWKGGVFVTCAPDVLYLRDHDSDGSADDRRVVLTGFETKGSTQLRVNAPLLGPDGWVWLASGLSGGLISNPERPDYPALNLKTDLRFDPHSGRFEAVDGRSQYGHSFDDSGGRFICMNRVQVQHVVLPSRYLKRNPHLAFSDSVQNCPELVPNPLLRGGGGAARIFPISKNITTADSHAGTFSAACAVTIWRGGALPDGYRGCAFSCDPTGNLVHVDKLEPRGATYAAIPMFKDREFLASRDDWFRPVFLTNGPDGALYICDMYRKVIEHPDYLPEEIRKQTDFESGKEMGRIWRISAIAKVEQTSRAQITSDEEKLRNPRRASEPGTEEESPAARLAAAASPDPRVRFLAALALGDVKTTAATEALAKIAAQDSGDRWTRAAVLSGIAGRESEFFRVFVADQEDATAGALDLLLDLGRMFPDVAALRTALDQTILGTGREEIAPMLAALIVGTCERSNTKLEVDADPWFAQLFAFLSAAAADTKTPHARRILYVRAIGCTVWRFARAPLLALSAMQSDIELRGTVLRAFAGFDEADVCGILLAPDRWGGYTPALRQTVVDALVSRDAHLSGVLAAIDSATLPAAVLSSQQRDRLLKHKNGAIRERSQKLFPLAPAGGRLAAFEAAKSALAVKPQPGNGRDVFKKSCALCHRLDQDGYAVGPDLFDIRNQSKESMLLHIVVPEHEVAPGFAAYLVETKDGRTLSGIIASETDESIRLRQPLGIEETILRSNIISLTASPASLMPPGLETAMTRQELADLLAYLRGEK